MIHVFIKLISNFKLSHLTIFILINATLGSATECLMNSHIDCIKNAKKGGIY